MAETTATALTTHTTPTTPTTPTSSNECIIEVRNVWTQFGTHVVHRDLNLRVQAGEVMSLVGGSGSGKSSHP